MQKSLIVYIVLIIVILIIVFLSQQAYFGGIGKILISDASGQIQTYLAKGSNWAMSKIYPAISGEVEKRGDMIKNEVSQEKQKVSENILDKAKNYISGVGNSILHPGTPQNCQSSTVSSGQ